MESKLLSEKRNVSRTSNFQCKLNIITLKETTNLCVMCGGKSNTGTDISPRIAFFHSVNNPNSFSPLSPE